MVCPGRSHQAREQGGQEQGAAREGEQQQEPAEFAHLARLTQALPFRPHPRLPQEFPTTISPELAELA